MANLLSMDYQPAAQRFAQNMQAFGQTVRLLAHGAVRQTMEEVGRQMDATAPVDTGALRANRTTVTSRRALTWSTGYTLDYAPVLEYGGYPRVGPKTMRLGGGDLGAGLVAGGGIYSKQAPLGWVRRALAAAREPLTKRVIDAVHQAWTGQAGGTAGGETAPVLGPGGLSALFGVEITV